MGHLTGSTSLAGAKAPCHVVSGGPVSHQHHSCVPMHLQGEMSQGPLQGCGLGPTNWPQGGTAEHHWETRAGGLGK